MVGGEESDGGWGTGTLCRGVVDDSRLEKGGRCLPDAAVVGLVAARVAAVPLPMRTVYRGASRRCGCAERRGLRSQSRAELRPVVK